VVLDKLSPFWGFLYSSKLILFLSLPLRKFFASFKSKNVLKIIREFQPEIIICTQTVASGVIAYLKSEHYYNGKLVIVFSDYHLHRFWLYEEADLYICNIEEQVAKLRLLGVPEHKIALTGTLVSQRFNRPVTKQEACAAFGLLTSIPTVLLFSGGRPREALREIFLALLRSSKTFQVVVVTGRNQDLKTELEQISPPSQHPAKVLGYVNNIEMLMPACDVMVGKTGGPTMAEAVIKKLPMVLTDIRPGHELINLEYLVKQGIVRYGKTTREAVFLAEQILLKKIVFDHDQSFKKIVKPEGSVTVAQALKILNPKPADLKIKNYQQS
jgi:processive 1,2-diacylglycerol beta-glucosyltransferase